MKIIKPKPFTFEAGTRSVLLLHGFTGHSADVRMIGRFLEKKGYTSHAPIYKGHGDTPEALVKSNPVDWWEDAKSAYLHLRDELGYKEIVVCGLSLGGALAAELAYTYEEIKGFIPMCTPMFFDNEEQLTKGFIQFATEYKQLERKDKETIKKEVNQLMNDATNIFNEMGKFITDISEHVKQLTIPTMIVQARNDQMINPKSATYIYEHVQSKNKELKWYEHSGHVITLDKEKEQLHDDIFTFLESLSWQN